MNTITTFHSVRLWRTPVRRRAFLVGSITLAAAFVFLLSANAASAATYYVSTSGNDSNPGTLSSPWRTIQRAANTVVAGDTVQIRGGTYNEQINFNNSGTSGNPITFTNYAGEVVTIDGAGISMLSYDYLLQIVGRQYIHIVGTSRTNFRVINAGGAGANGFVKIHNSSNIYIKSVTFDVSNGIGFDLSSAANNRITFDDVEVSHWGGVDTTGIYPDGMSNLAILNSSFHDVSGTGNNDAITALSNNGVLIHNNLVYNIGDGIDLGQIGSTPTQNAIVRYNTVRNGDGRLYTLSGDGNADPSFNTHHVVFYKNLAHNGGTNHELYQGVHDIEIWNTTHHNSTIGVWIRGECSSDTGPLDNVSLYNSILAPVNGISSNTPFAQYDMNNVNTFKSDFNIFCGFSDFSCTGIFAEWDPNGSNDGTGCAGSEVANYSSLTAWQTDTGEDFNSFRQDPKFVNATAKDYQLQSTSPAINAGTFFMRATAPGTNATTISVNKDPNRYFVSPSRFYQVPGDRIQIEGCGEVTITSMSTNSITFTPACSWTTNAGVHVPWQGSRPDIGAFEYGGTSPSPQCSDGRDNDADGLTDYPADPGCTSLSDTDETNTASDTTPPVRTNGAPTGTLPAGTTETTLSLNTNENAACKWGSATGQSYTNMPNTFSTTGGTSHATGVSALTNGSNYTIYFRCRDTAGNENTTDYSVSFSIANPQASALIAHWKLDETSGTTAVDSATTDGAQNATLSGGPLWTSGRVGGALSFDGVNDAGTTVALPLSTTQTITLAFWLNQSSFNLADGLAFELTPDFNGSATGLLVNPNSSFCNAFELALQGNVGYQNACYSAPSTNTWHHYAAIFDKIQAANEISLYIDGVLQTPTSRPNIADNTNTFGTDPLYLMSRAASSLFNSGTLDDVRLYNHALTPEQIQALFSGGGTKSADLNGDGTVNSLDWSIMNAAWLSANASADLNSDGVVNSFDWSIMNSKWGTSG